MKRGTDITIDRLHELFAYDENTGVLTRKIRTSNKIKAGDAAGFMRADGYWIAHVDGSQIMVHRIIWAMMTNEWPTEEIDHENHDPSDNRWDNLREVSHLQNMQNTKVRSDNITGFKGVSRKKNKKANPWVAQISVDGGRNHLGYFPTAELAYAAYCRAALELHGEYACVA